MATREAVTSRLGERLRAEIRVRGPLPFREFMRKCLYDAQDGYYAGGTDRIGRRGDFVTSVSVGPAFGGLLATWAAGIFGKLKGPGPFTILEQGSHDGRLAADILDAFAPEMSELEYVIVEPLPALEAAQAATLGGWASRVRWVKSCAELAPAPVRGVFVANELLDAFPVERVVFEDGRWHRECVGVSANGGFVRVTAEIDGGELADFTASLGGNYPNGYTTEFCPDVGPWIREAAAALSEGSLLVIDYGRDADDYRRPERRDGTLRGYVAHQRCDDPFRAPGETDLTADVDFSHLAAAARAAGLVPGRAERQETFLVRHAGARLQEIERRGAQPSDAAWIRQFQSLTHPGLMGSAFRVMEFEVPARRHESPSAAR